MSISTSGFRGLLLAQILPGRGRTTSRPLRFLPWQKSPHFRGLSVTTKSPSRQASQAASCHHACLHRCHRAHTRTWHGTALCSNIIGTLPREPMAASGQVYPKLQRTCSMKGTSMRSQLAAMFLVFSLSANAQTLSGAIDMHTHSDPDGVPRKIDAVDLARLAKERGMRAIVLKNHYEPTASLAYIVRKDVPGIEVFGGISLDLTVGGVNPAAVEWMTKVRGGYGRVVWLPTFDAEAQVKLTRQQRPFAPVVRDGKVVPEVAQVIAIAARNNLVLETGHSSGSEDLVIIQEARRQGVQNVMVTHALTNPGGPLTLSEIQQAARLGAYIELVYGGLSEDLLRRDAEVIRAVGASAVVLSTDLGQPNNPLHPDGLLAFYKGLIAQGISEADIVQMSQTNPAKLLGLKP